MNQHKAQGGSTPSLQELEKQHPTKEDYELLEILWDRLHENEFSEADTISLLRFQDNTLKNADQAGWEGDRIMSAYYRLRHAKSEDPQYRDLAEIFEESNAESAPK